MSREETAKDVMAPHMAIIYDGSDLSGCRRIIETYLASCNLGVSGVELVTAQPETDCGCFRRVSKGGFRIDDLPMSVTDISKVLTARRNIAERIPGIVKACGTKGGSRLVIANWTHLAYDHFETVIAAEKKEQGSKNLVCCYRGEGFWSLDPQQIAQTLELHERVYFGSTPLDMVT